MAALALFFKLLMGHAVGDYVLQPSPMSQAKCRNNSLQAQHGPDFPPWYYWLSAHALTHAGIVYLITGSYLFAVIELLSHWLIDHLKCENKIGLHQDQALHLAFKALYCVLLAV